MALPTLPRAGQPESLAQAACYSAPFCPPTMFDAQVFEPPAPAAMIVEQAAPAHGTADLLVTSHQWHYRVTGNTLLPEAKIPAVLGQAADPQAAVQALSAVYQQAGYLLVAVKAVSGGPQTVWIQVVQGQVTEAQAPAGVAGFFSGLQGRADLRRDELLRRTVLAQAYTARNGDALHANFAPSSTPGGSDLEVQLTPRPDARKVSGAFQLGNTGSRYASRYTTGLSLAVDPGRGLEFTGNFVTGLANWSAASKGSQYKAGSLGLSAITPWGIYGVSYQKTTYRIGDVAAPLFPQGDVRAFVASGNQLLHVTDRSRLGVNESVTHIANTQSVYGGTYQLADQNYNFASLGLQYSASTVLAQQTGQLSLGLTLNKGLTGLRGTLDIARDGAPSPRFRSMNYSLSWIQPLPKSALLQLNLNGQRAFDTLPSQQQWVLGGLGSLSAYFPGVLVGDSGYSARLSLQTQPWAWKGWSVTPNAFVETGGAAYTYTPPGSPRWQSLTDLGFGLNWQSPKGTTLTAVIARGIGNSHVSASTRDSNHAAFFFNLQQSF